MPQINSVPWDIRRPRGGLGLWSGLGLEFRARASKHLMITTCTHRVMDSCQTPRQRRPSVNRNGVLVPDRALAAHS